MFGSIYGFAKRHVSGLGYIYITALFAVALLLIQHNKDDQVKRDRTEALRNDYRDCLSRQSGRQTLRDVIIVSTSQSGAIRLDLTKVPGFSDLDPATQTFFRNLAPPPSPESTTTTLPVGAVPDPDPNNALQKAMLDRVPVVGCIDPDAKGK